MTLPHAPRNLQQERAGILAVAREINRLGLIWRETPMTDVGIDGQIEFVDDAGRATGQLVGVQVKSGVSYLREGGDAWRFYPEEKHRFYWERYPLPVLLFLHSPVDDVTYWVDARQALRNPQQAPAYIPVPKGNRLQDAAREDLFASLGASGLPFLPLERVLTTMAERMSPSPSFSLSYLDLFANGLTNLARSIYYGMDLAVEVARVLTEEKTGMGLSFGPREHDFLFGFVRFLVEQHLADINISDCLIDWYDWQLQPTFIAPLTSRGRALVSLIDLAQDALHGDGRLPGRQQLAVAQERFVEMLLTPADSDRISLIRTFGELVPEWSGQMGRSTRPE